MSVPATSNASVRDSPEIVTRSVYVAVEIAVGEAVRRGLELSCVDADLELIGIIDDSGLDEASRRISRSPVTTGRINMNSIVLITEFRQSLHS